MPAKRAYCAALCAALCCCLLAAACSRQDRQSRQGLADAMPLVAVSIPPQAWFVSRIAGEKARITILAGPGQNPHNYEPSPKQIYDLAGAGAWILSGTEFEISLRPKVEAMFPGLRIVDGTEGVQFRSLEEEEHGEEGIDRHTWLGRSPAKILAAHVRDTLSLIDPANAAYYAEQYEALIREIDDEFNWLRAELAPLKGKNVFVYHPSFGYFFDEFGIHQEAVETGGKEPGPRDLSRLIEKAKREQAAVIFVQAQFPAHAAGTVAAAAGAELVSMDPLAQDWLANIRRMGEVLKKASSSSDNAMRFE